MNALFHLCTLPVLLVASVLSAQVPSEAELPAFLARALENQRRQYSILTEHTSEYRDTYREDHWFGRKRSERVEAGESYQSWQRDVLVPTERDGKPLSPGQIEKARQVAIRQMEQDQTSGPRNWSCQEYGFLRDGLYLSTFDFLRFTRLHHPRPEIHGGRPMLAVNFGPPGNSPGAGVYAHLSGTLWIDMADVILAEFIARPEPEGEIFWHLIFVRQADGAWLPAYSRINPHAHPDYFGGRTWDSIRERSHFQRFTVEAGELQRVQ